MSYVVQNDWKFDKDRLKSELNRVLAEHGVNERREGGLHGIALSSQDGSLQSGFNFNVRIQYAYPEYFTFKLKNLNMSHGKNI